MIFHDFPHGKTPAGLGCRPTWPKTARAVWRAPHRSESAPHPATCAAGVAVGTSQWILGDGWKKMKPFLFGICWWVTSSQKKKYLYIYNSIDYIYIYQILYIYEIQHWYRSRHWSWAVATVLKQFCSPSIPHGFFVVWPLHGKLFDLRQEPGSRTAQFKGIDHKSTSGWFRSYPLVN